MIRVRNLTVRYDSGFALQDVTLDIPTGQCVLVTGPSGCGKSTLARVLTGLIPHAISAQFEGAVHVAGMDVREYTIAEIAQRVGAVFQNPSSQLFHLRVEDEVAFGPRNLGLGKDEVRERVSWALSATNLMGSMDRRPSELSGGEKQQVAIAAALAMRPRVLVLDEPFASLDMHGIRQVTATLQALRERHGVTIVLIEHRLVEGARLADRVLLMAEGRVIADGEPTTILSDQHLWRNLGLRRLMDYPIEPWRSLVIEDSRHRGDLTALIEMRGVSAGYGGRRVIQDINLTLDPGEFVALVGDNGAGKSTLALVAAGLLKPLAGTVCFNGGELKQPGLNISLLFQNPLDQLFTESVNEEVAFGPRNYGLFEPERHEQILAEADLVDLRSRRLMALSGGQQQRTAMAACLSLCPRLLMLDEPTIGQDWGHLQRLMDFLTTLSQKGTTILLITHDYKLVCRYAQRVLVMEEGKIALEGRFRRSEEEKAYAHVEAREAWR